jgi:hypothetical protein
MMYEKHNKQTHSSARDWISKNNIEKPVKQNAKRERFLTFLKGRHGYTNEEAVDELDRLLKQFYRMNKCSGIYRTSSNSKDLKGRVINNKE